MSLGLFVSCSPSSDNRTATRPDDLMGTRSDYQGNMDQFGPIIAMYGRPEKDDSTENDIPRPAIVTRFIEYRPENVKIAFVPIAKLGAPPPYKKWNVIGYIDMKTDTKMSKQDAAERLKTRLQ